MKRFRVVRGVKTRFTTRQDAFDTFSAVAHKLTHDWIVFPIKGFWIAFMIQPKTLLFPVGVSPWEVIEFRVRSDRDYLPDWRSVWIFDSRVPITGKVK